MVIVIKGSGTLNFPGFSEEEALNIFKVEENCAYYIMPDVEFTVTSSSSTSPLTLFIANCDI